MGEGVGLIRSVGSAEFVASALDGEFVAMDEQPPSDLLFFPMLRHLPRHGVAAGEEGELVAEGWHGARRKF